MSETLKADRPWYLRPNCLLPALLIPAIMIAGIALYFSIYQGRTISRFTGIPTPINLPDCVTNLDQVVSISFHSKTGGETVKDVTYICDGRMFSHEYNDFGILQGSIEWKIKR